MAVLEQVRFDFLFGCLLFRNYCSWHFSFPFVMITIL